MNPGEVSASPPTENQGKGKVFPLYEEEKKRSGALSLKKSIHG